MSTLHNFVEILLLIFGILACAKLLTENKELSSQLEKKNDELIRLRAIVTQYGKTTDILVGGFFREVKKNQDLQGKLEENTEPK